MKLLLLILLLLLLLSLLLILLTVPVLVQSLYRSLNSVRVIKSSKLRWVGQVDRMEEGRRAFEILTGRTIGRRPIRRPRQI